MSRRDTVEGAHRLGNICGIRRMYAAAQSGVDDAGPLLLPATVAAFSTAGGRLRSGVAYGYARDSPVRPYGGGASEKEQLAAAVIQAADV